MKLKELRECPHILVQVYSAIICYRKPGEIPEGTGLDAETNDFNFKIDTVGQSFILKKCFIISNKNMVCNGCFTYKGIYWRITLNYCWDWEKSYCTDTVFHRDLHYPVNICLQYCLALLFSWIELEMTHGLDM